MADLFFNVGHYRTRSGKCLCGVLAGMPYGVTPADVPTLAGVLLLILIVTAVAALGASRVEPMEVLREE
jgi:ABC-type lipoprotein release transport system permease subunit